MPEETQEEESDSYHLDKSESFELSMDETDSKPEQDTEDTPDDQKKIFNFKNPSSYFFYQVFPDAVS